MNKVEIKSRLEESYSAFLNYIDSLSKDDFDYAPQGKWSAAQQAEHLIKSTSPLVKAFSYPKFMIRYKFGKANRSSRSYEELVERYLNLLSETHYQVSSAYQPNASTHHQQKKLKETQLELIDKINHKLNKWSEDELDQYIFPHPLLGKLTGRELLYFTIYHAHHHHQLIKSYLKGV